MSACFAVVASLILTAVLLSEVSLSACSDVRGKVTCLDCNDQTFNLSGIQVLVKCDKPEKLWTAMTEADGSFEVAAEISTSQLPPFECVAKILGGPHPTYASRQTMVSELVKKSHLDYSTSTPLVIYSRCPKRSCSSEDAVGSSKTELATSNRMGIGAIKLLLALYSHYRYPISYDLWEGYDSLQQRLTASNLSTSRWNLLFLLRMSRFAVSYPMMLLFIYKLTRIGFGTTYFLVFFLHICSILKIKYLKIKW